MQNALTALFSLIRSDIYVPIRNVLNSTSLFQNIQLFIIDCLNYLFHAFGSTLPDFDWSVSDFNNLIAEIFSLLVIFFVFYIIYLVFKFLLHTFRGLIK